MLITDFYTRSMHKGAQSGRAPKTKIARAISRLEGDREPVVPSYPAPQAPARSWRCQYITDRGKCGEKRDGKSSYCREHRALCCVPASAS